MNTQPQGMPNDNGGPARKAILAAVGVLVTGGTSGIGLAVAARCLAEGPPSPSSTAMAPPSAARSPG